VYYANGFLVMKVNVSLGKCWVHTFDLLGQTRDKEIVGDFSSHSRKHTADSQRRVMAMAYWASGPVGQWVVHTHTQRLHIHMYVCACAYAYVCS